MPQLKPKAAAAPATHVWDPYQVSGPCAQLNLTLRVAGAELASGKSLSPLFLSFKCNANKVFQKRKV